MVPISEAGMEASGAGHRRGVTSGSGHYSFQTSVNSVHDACGEVEEESLPVEEKVFVAVAEELKNGKNTLVWTLQNLAKNFPKIVIAHVHSPAQMIPIMGAKMHVSRMQPQEVNAYRLLEREETEKNLDEYVMTCTRLKVSCEKVIIEKDDVAKGLEELIALHGITKLVMGAAADKHYSKRMKTLKSKTAQKLTEKAAPSCKIWFICKGILICTREANTTIPAIPPSLAPGIASPLSAMNLNRSENEVLSSNGSPMHHLMNRSTTEVGGPHSRGAGDQNVHGRTRTPRSSVDSWLEFGRRSQSSAHGSSTNDDTASISISEVGSAMHRPTDESDDYQFSSPPQELEDTGANADIYDKLKDALNEAECSKKEAYEESNRRRKAERDLLCALQRVKESECSHLREIRQRKALEEMLSQERQDTEATKRQRDETYEQLHDVNKQKQAMEQCITKLECSVKDSEEKLAASKYLLQVLQKDYEKLLHERDAAILEAEELRHKNKHSFSAIAEVINAEFSFFELQQATQGFNASHKIGEGGFGNVYKGFLRNTVVAIKLLHPQSLQGQSEFHQEGAVLSRVRHPNLVTLIGACTEAFGLIYEFLPNGSLEDRLACMNNTPPLTWQVRTRIIGEICSALVFLHSNKPYPVVHGDLKPSNILLDANFVSKLGDFGICRLLIQSNTSTTSLYRTMNPKGTFAYMDPEFLSSGELTSQSDVYSFGIIILRLLTGRPPQNIATIVEEALEKGNLHSIIDTSAGSWPFVQANQLAHIGLRCTELSRRRRPDLAGDVWKVVEPLMKSASLSARPSLFISPLDERYTPSYFICPIFQEVMNDPHIAADGFTYEAEAIRGWLDSGHDTSPMTNLKLAHSELTPNRALRSAILEWLQQHHDQQ